MLLIRDTLIWANGVKLHIHKVLSTMCVILSMYNNPEKKEGRNDAVNPLPVWSTHNIHIRENLSLQPSLALYIYIPEHESSYYAREMGDRQHHGGGGGGGRGNEEDLFDGFGDFFGGGGDMHMEFGASDGEN